MDKTVSQLFKLRCLDLTIEHLTFVINDKLHDAFGQRKLFKSKKRAKISYRQSNSYKQTLTECFSL